MLGDFGIVYVPNAPDRLTRFGERVGPRDYMPPWANLGVRHEKVEPCFDVYMLGKLLWSMVDGRAVLPREYYKHAEFDLTKTFSNNPDFYLINHILDQCVVEQAAQCLPSAQELLTIVERLLRITDSGGQLLEDGVPRPCHVCGNGYYQPEILRPNHRVASLQFWLSGGAVDIGHLSVRTFVCSNCGHVELFKTAPT